MLAVGECVGGRYVLEREVGQGAMGAVWKDTTLGRSFAIKFLKDGAGHGRERFLREARLAASVQSRFVVSTVDQGVTDEGTPYLVMEYLEGESLAERLLRRPLLPVRALITMAIEVLTGLEAVHRAGVVHRDVKPDNVLLVRDGDGLVPKLVDFGIARSEGRSGDEAKLALLTMPGMAIGTPAYMSPEQARASSTVDRRSDLYSVAVLVYHAVSGVLPYDDTKISGLLARVERGGAAPLREVRFAAGTALSDVVARAMRVDPEERFTSARQMAIALERANQSVPATLLCPGRFGLDDGPHPATPPRTPPRSSELLPCARRREATLTAVDGWLARRLRALPRRSTRARTTIAAGVTAFAGVATLAIAWSWPTKRTEPALAPVATATTPEAERADAPVPVSAAAAATKPPELYRDPGF